MKKWRSVIMLLQKVYTRASLFLILFFICAIIFCGIKYRGRNRQEQNAQFIGDFRKEDMSPPIKRKFQLKSFGTDSAFCSVKCSTGRPCEYANDVKFRVIVLTYSRPKSLNKCLRRLHDLRVGNDSLSVHIWIDRSKSGSVDDNTLVVARDFVKMFKRGTACVHVREKNAYIIGQWIDTWRPKIDTSEIGLILEDDVDVSPFVYIWLRAVTNKYGKDPDIGGYTLQSENLMFQGSTSKPMVVHRSEKVFAYRIIGTWGFAPHPVKWRHFQDWYHDVRPKGILKPYVPNIGPTKTYKQFEMEHSEDSMWEMWHIYHQYINSYFVVYNNLMTFNAPQGGSLLSTNRRERGLHFSESETIDNSENLLKKWDPTYTDLPSAEHLTKYDYDGNLYKKLTD